MANKKPTKQVEALAKSIAEAITQNSNEIDPREAYEDAKAAKDQLTRQRNEQHYWITPVVLGPDDTETEIYVGAAGVSYLLKKGERMPVPVSVLNALALAKVDMYAPVIDANGVKRQVRRIYDRYPFTNHGEASKEDVANWKAEQKAQHVKRSGVVEEEVQIDNSRPEMTFSLVE